MMLSRDLPLAHPDGAGACHGLGTPATNDFLLVSRPAPELSDDERTEVKKVARALLDQLKQLLVLNSRQKAAARSQLNLTIEDTLDTGLPRAYDKPLYQQKCSTLFEHVFESHPERDAGVYAAAS